MNDRIESTRQQKIGRQIQRDISEIFSKEAASLLCGAMVSVVANSLRLKWMSTGTLPLSSGRPNNVRAD